MVEFQKEKGQIAHIKGGAQMKMKPNDILVGMVISKQSLLEMGFYFLSNSPVGENWTNRKMWIVWMPQSRKVLSIHKGD